MIPDDTERAIARLAAAAAPFAAIHVGEACPDDGYVHVDDVPPADRIYGRHVRALRAAVDEAHRVLGRHRADSVLSARR